MDTQEIIEMVNLYSDKELAKDKEVLLFSRLAENEEAREYFFNLNYIKDNVEKNIQPLPMELEERIFSSIREKEIQSMKSKPRIPLFNYISLAAAFILLVLSTLFYFEMQDYRHEVQLVTQKVSEQNRTIDLILNNSLPPAEVRSRSINEVVVRANL